MYNYYLTNYKRRENIFFSILPYNCIYFLKYGESIHNICIYEMLDSGNKTGLRYVLDLEGTLNEEAVEKVKNEKAPKMLPARTHLNLMGVIKELCWVLCCCKHV